MEHLSTESLARLVDEAPTPEEAAHLAGCPSCRHEREALAEQTEALGGLPEILPPKGDWQVIEARLRSEGLVQSPGLFRTLGLARTPSWMRAAAAILLFLGGAGVGSTLTGDRGAGPLGPALVEASTVEEAAFAMRVAEESYVSTVARYRELLARDGEDDMLEGDPYGRYAALEHLVSVSQAAVRQAPADPFLNGILTSALAERDAMARLVSAGGDNWF